MIVTTLNDAHNTFLLQNNPLPSTVAIQQLLAILPQMCLNDIYNLACFKHITSNVVRATSFTSIPPLDITHCLHSKKIAHLGFNDILYDLFQSSLFWDCEVLKYFF